MFYNKKVAAAQSDLIFSLLQSVADRLDSLDEQVKVFFKKCLQPNVKPEWKEEQYKKILEVGDVALQHHYFMCINLHF